VTSVLQTTTVCNPVDVNGAGILDPAAHLTCHQIRDVPGQPYFQARDVVVDNAFGTETLTVSGAQSLCVPSTHNSKIFADLNIDHFKCYTARTARSTPAFTPQEVRLSDAFETKVTSVLQTTTVCNPVDVNGAGILDPAAHLTCHQIRDVPGQPYFQARDVMVDNAFGTETLTVSGAQTLCVPSAQVPR